MKQMHHPCLNNATHIFRGNLVWCGTYILPPTDAKFQRKSHVGGASLIVFPRLSIEIKHEGKLPVVASPNVAMLYNDGQGYTRKQLSPEGDYCDFFAFCPSVLVEAIASYDPTVWERQHEPFKRVAMPVNAGIYLTQRQIVEYINHTPEPDALFVEETMLGVLSDLVQGMYEKMPATPCSKRQHHQYDAIHEAHAILSTRFYEPLSIDTLSQELSLSPFHLSRLFRHFSGHTIHQYLTHIRLRTALTRLREGATDLTELALSLGYSSHSHFSTTFRRTFGLPPSDWRNAVAI